MQNVTGEHYLARMVRAEDRIVTATGEGRVSFVDADDIAAVAVHALLDETRPAAELVLTGPEALSYRAWPRSSAWLVIVGWPSSR